MHHLKLVHTDVHDPEMLDTDLYSDAFDWDASDWRVLGGRWDTYLIETVPDATTWANGTILPVCEENREHIKTLVKEAIDQDQENLDYARHTIIGTQFTTENAPSFVHDVDAWNKRVKNNPAMMEQILHHGKIPEDANNSSLWPNLSTIASMIGGPSDENLFIDRHTWLSAKKFLTQLDEEELPTIENTETAIYVVDYHT